MWGLGMWGLGVGDPGSGRHRRGAGVILTRAKVQCAKRGKFCMFATELKGQLGVGLWAP